MMAMTRESRISGLKHSVSAGRGRPVLLFYSQGHPCRMTKVIVKSKICSKTHIIDVTMDDDGDLAVKIESDCDNVNSYAKLLGDKLTMADVTEREGSKLTDNGILAPLTMTCLVPVGVLDAAWLELGMLSKNLAREVGSNEISYEMVE